MTQIPRPYFILIVMIQAAVLAGSGLIGSKSALAQNQMIFFQIATGGVDGTYYPLGTAIAECHLSPAGVAPLRGRRGVRREGPGGRRPKLKRVGR